MTLLAEEIAGPSVEPDAGPARLVVATGAAFAVMDGRKLLFSEERQQLHELNDIAAYIWCRTEEGAAPDAVADGLAGLGVSPGAAGAYVRDALSEWCRLGLVVDEDPAKAPDHRHQSIEVAGLSIRIRYADGALARLVAPAFAHLEIDAASGRPVDLSLAIDPMGDRFRLLSGDQDIGTFAENEIVPALKAQLTADVLASGAYALAIHAASLARGGRMLLLCGEPGAGKTTLTVALAQAGFGYAGDDIALLGPHGRVAGVPFAASVKSGAWPLVSRFRRDLEAVRIFRRSDGQDVRYLPPAGPVAAAPLPLGWVVLLRRQPDGPARLAHLDRIEAMRSVLAEATAPGQRLSAAVFGLLARAMAGADCHVLSYARLEDAVRELDRACA